MENALLPRTVNLRLVAIVNIYATLAGNGRGNGVEEYKDIKVQYMQTTGCRAYIATIMHMSLAYPSFHLSIIKPNSASDAHS